MEATADTPEMPMWGSGPLSLQLERPPYTVLFRIERDIA